MPPTRVPVTFWAMERIVVLDLASVRFTWGEHRRSLSVATGAGELLATVAVPAGTEPRWAAFLACDAALETARVTRDDERGRLVTARVALYNPLSFQIAVSGIPATRVFDPETPLLLPADGLLATLDEDLLELGGRTLVETELDVDTVARAAGAHPTPR